MYSRINLCLASAERAWEWLLLLGFEGEPHETAISTSSTTLAISTIVFGAKFNERSISFIWCLVPFFVCHFSSPFVLYSLEWKLNKIGDLIHGVTTDSPIVFSVVFHGLA